MRSRAVSLPWPRIFSSARSSGTTARLDGVADLVRHGVTLRAMARCTGFPGCEPRAGRRRRSHEKREHIGGAGGITGAADTRRAGCTGGAPGSCVGVRRRARRQPLDVPEVVDGVVDEVAGERSHGEHARRRCAARRAPTDRPRRRRTTPRRARRRRPARRPRRPGPARRSARRRPSRPGPSWRTAGRPRRASGARRGVEQAEHVAHVAAVLERRPDVGAGSLRARPGGPARPATPPRWPGPWPGRPRRRSLPGSTPHSGQALLEHPRPVLAVARHGGRRVSSPMRGRVRRTPCRTARGFHDDPVAGRSSG